MVSSSGIRGKTLCGLPVTRDIIQSAKQASLSNSIERRGAVQFPQYAMQRGTCVMWQTGPLPLDVEGESELVWPYTTSAVFALST